MKTTSFLAGLAAIVPFAAAQVSILPNGTFSCALPNADYCAGDSLSTNIIIRCTNGIGQPGNCNDNLAGVPPIGVKPFAPCYQSSSTAGDAACSYNGTAYPDSGTPFQIPTNGSATTSGSVGTITAMPTGYSTGGMVPTGSISLSVNATLTAQPTQFTGAAASGPFNAAGAYAGLVGLAGIMLGL